jgi:hypothetical protein
MKQSANTTIKDLFLFAVLISLVVYAYKRTHLYLNLHTNSLTHELDRNFADQIYSVQRQARVAKTILEQTGATYDHLVVKVEKIEHTLKGIEEKYSNNSPGLLLLGPIGSTSIVLKEQQLENKLLEEAISIASVLTPLLPKEVVRAATAKIDAQIDQNQEYINYLLQHKTVHGL